MSVNVRITVASPEDVKRYLRDDEVYIDDLPSAHTINLRRDWDALHYLLTGSLAEGRGPLSFIKHGGEDINMGANQRLFRQRSVQRIHAALSRLSMKVCRQRFREMVRDETDEVYPGSWEGTDSGLLFELIKELKALVRDAAKCGYCLLYSDDA